jgi:hypothetical protein
MEKRAYAQTLSHRPGSQPLQKGVLYEDFGSGFDSPKRRDGSEASVDPDDSDDELDGFIPRNSSPARPPSHPARKEKRDLDDVLKELKFKKNKKPDSEVEVSGTPTPSKENGNAKRGGDRMKKGEVDSDARNANAVASSSATRPLRDNAVTRNQSAEARVGTKRSADIMQKSTSGEAKSQERPRPRPVPKARVPLAPATAQAKPKPLSKLSVTSSSSVEVSPSAKGSVKRQERQVRPTTSAFPKMSPLGGKGKDRETDRTDRKQRKETLAVDTAGRKGKGKETKRGFSETGLSPLSSPTKAARSFLPSPLGTPNRKQKPAATEFPAPSPLRTDGRAQASVKAKRKALPFPMDALEGSPLSSSSKRRSVGSDSDEERDRKRYKNQPVYVSLRFLSSNLQLSLLQFVARLLRL